MSHIAIVLTTLGASTDAAAMARTLVEEELAACVNILPGVRSVYRWQGAVEADEEQLLLIKTTEDALKRLEARVRELHPYELPEFVVLGPSGGSTAYLEWVAASVAAR